MDKVENHEVKRPRIDALLESAINYPFVVVSAGAGYGKTHAVYSFFRERKALVIWTPLSDADNNEAHFWETFSHAYEAADKQLADKIKRIGFPDSDDAFAKYVTMVRREMDHMSKWVFIIDDFHLIHSRKIYSFFERHPAIISKATVIFISRVVPEINFFRLLSDKKLFYIEEKDLRFTENEIANIFQGCAVPPGFLKDVETITNGWAMGINLIAGTLKRTPGQTQAVLSASKRNIEKIIETEIFMNCSEQVQRFLIKLSLVNFLSEDLVRELDENYEMENELANLHAYIRFDVHLNAYMIHHLALSVLEKKQHLLNDDEKRDVWSKTGDWCERNGYTMDAFRYYGLLGEYEKIAQLVSTLYTQLPPDISEYVYDIFTGAPEDYARRLDARLFAPVHIRVLMSLGHFDEAIRWSKIYEEQFLALPDSSEKYLKLTSTYLGLAGTRQLQAATDNVFDFDKYYELAAKSFSKCDKTTVRPQYIDAYAIPSWASWVGTPEADAMEKNIAAIKRSMPFASNTSMKGSMCGYDDLVYGELLFYRENLKESESVLNRAVADAVPNDQYDIAGRALLYLMRIKFMQGNLKMAIQYLEELKILSENPRFRIGAFVYDFARAFYHLGLRQPESIPDWLCGNYSYSANGIFMENYINHIKLRYNYLTRQYHEVLAFTESEFKNETLLYGKIEMKVFEALSYYQVRRKEDAATSFRIAYELASPNEITMCFVFGGKDMRTITAAFLRDKVEGVPEDWLKMLNRRASSFVKRQLAIISEVEGAGKAEKNDLSPREAEILHDISSGLSRSEIAATRVLSINTVKMISNSLYNKLGVNNMQNAIRVATERGLLESY